MSADDPRACACCKADCRGFFCDSCEDAMQAEWETKAQPVGPLADMIERHCEAVSFQRPTKGFWFVLARLQDGSSWATSGGSPLAILEALRGRLGELA